MKNYFKYIPFFIVSIIFIVLSVVFYFIYAQININNEKASQSLADIKNESTRREEIRLINQSIDRIKQDRDLIGTHFAQASDIVPFLNTIEALAPSVGAKAETSSVDLLKDDSGLVVKINVVGNFDSIYKFLMLLENSPYELDFISVIIQKDAAGVPSSTDVAPITPSKDVKWQAVFTIKLLSFIK